MCKTFLDTVIVTCFYHDINDTFKYCPNLDVAMQILVAINWFINTLVLKTLMLAFIMFHH